MSRALVDKLTKWFDLSQGDRATLRGISTPFQLVKRREVLIAEGSKPDGVLLLIEGWAIRYKQKIDGRRQIIGFLIPGDLCDVDGSVLDQMDHSVAMVSWGKVARLSDDRMRDLAADSQDIARALAWTTLVDAAVLREWVVNIGSRNGPARVAHLLCELYVRMDNVDLVEGGSAAFPLTQQDIADALGLTPIYVNRCLTLLRQQGLLTIEDRHLTVPDLPALMQAAEFNADYLHVRAAPHRPSDGDERIAVSR